MAESQFISFEDALEELQMDESQLKALVEGGTLQMFMDSGKQMFKRADIEEFKRKAETDQTVVFVEDSSDESDAESAEETSQIFLIEEGEEAQAEESDKELKTPSLKTPPTELFSEFVSESAEEVDKEGSTSSLELEEEESAKDSSTSTIELSGEEEDKEGSTSKIDTATIETLLSDDDSDQTSSLPVAAAPEKEKESDDPIFDFDEDVGISLEGEDESGGSSAETGVLLDESSSDILGTVEDEESSSELALEAKEEGEIPTLSDEDESDTALQAIDLGETPGIEGETTDDVTGDLLEIVEGEDEGEDVVEVLEAAEDETAPTAEAGVGTVGEEPSDTALLEAEEIEEDVAYEGIAQPSGPAFTPYAAAPAGHAWVTSCLIAATLLMVYTTIILINMTINHSNIFTDWIPGIFSK